MPARLDSLFHLVVLSSRSPDNYRHRRVASRSRPLVVWHGGRDGTAVVVSNFRQLILRIAVSVEIVVVVATHRGLTFSFLKTIFVCYCFRLGLSLQALPAKSIAPRPPAPESLGTRIFRSHTDM